MQVSVRDNDINSALRVLKRKMQREGTFRDMKRRRAYEETIGAPRPGAAEAIRRHRKMLRKRLEREAIDRSRRQLRWIICQPTRRFRPNITVVTRLAPDNWPAKRRQPLSRRICGRSRFNTNDWPNAPITVRCRPALNGCPAAMREHRAARSCAARRRAKYVTTTQVCDWPDSPIFARSGPRQRGPRKLQDHSIAARSGQCSPIPGKKPVGRT